MMKTTTAKKTWLSFSIGLLLVLSLLMVSFSAPKVSSFAAEKAEAATPTLIGSELISNGKDLVLPTSKIATKSGDQQNATDCNFNRAFDGNTSTTWQSPWKGNLTPLAKFIFDEAQAITGLRYRSAMNNNIDGIIKTYSVSTSTDGTAFVPVVGLQNVAFPFKHGTHNMEFGQTVFAKYINLKFTVGLCVNVSEFNFNYIPTSEADLGLVEAEITETLSKMSTAGTAEAGKYTTAKKAALQASFVTAKAMAQATDDERVAKGTAFFKIASDIVRGVNMSTAEISDNIDTANALLNAAKVGDLPLQWLKADYDTFSQSITAAEKLLEVSYAEKGAVSDAVDALTDGITDFKISFIKPIITPERVLTGKTIDTATLMDGTNENRYQLESVSVGNDGVALVIDYKQEAKLISANISSWFATSQGSAAIKLEYWNGTQYLPIVGSIAGGNTSDASGKIVLGWTTNSSMTTEVKNIAFNEITTQRIRLTIFKSPNHVITSLDGISFGQALLESDMFLKVTPKNARIAEGESLTLETLVLPMSAPNKAVTWKSSDDNIASVDASGVVTAKTISANTAIVSITGSTVFGNATSVCEITITRGKPSLIAQYEAAKKLNQTKYTVNSWAKLITALDAAKIVIDNTSAATAEILAQITALQTAVTELVVDTGDKTVLQAKYDAALLLKQAAYTAASWAIFNEAMDLISVMIEDNELTQAEVDAAVVDLDSAIAQLVNLGDKAALQTKYDQVKGTQKGNYTDATYSSFTLALNEAKAVLDNANALQTDIDPKLTALNAAFSGLVEKPVVVVVNKASLQAKYDEVKATAKGNYTDATFGTFATALAAAKTVLDNAAATQAEVDLSITSLTEAFSGLTEKAVATEKGCGAIALGGNNVGFGAIALLALCAAGFGITRRKKQI